MWLAASVVVALAVVHLRLVYDEPRVRPALGTAAQRTAAAGAQLPSAAARGTARAWTVVRRTAARPMAQVVAAGVAVGVLWSLTFWRLVTRGDEVTVLGINDYPKHLASAQLFRLAPFRLNIPEFLCHAVTKGYELAFGIRLGSVVALVSFTTLAYVGVVLVLLERPRARGEVLTRKAAMALAAGYFVMESPVLALLLLRMVPADTPFSTLHWWGNPTYVAAMPFAFLALPLINRAVDASEAGDGSWPARARLRWLTTVVVLGTLAKPTFTLMLLPALPVYLLLRRVRFITLWRLGLWAVLPTALVVAWQMWFLGTGQSGDFQSSWTFDPPVEPIYGWAKAGPVFAFPILLIGLALVISNGAFARERSVQLVATTLLFAVPLMLTIRETGDKRGEGNMAVPAQACIGVMLVLVVRTMAWEALASWRRHRGDGRPLGWRFWLASVVGSALLVGGAVSLLDGAGVLQARAIWELQYQGT
jgi:hypothetical protein